MTGPRPFSTADLDDECGEQDATVVVEGVTSRPGRTVRADEDGVLVGG